MRVMQSPGGMAIMIVAGLLSSLLVIAVIAVLVALAVFLIRRSRVGPAVVQRAPAGPSTSQGLAPTAV